MISGDGLAQIDAITRNEVIFENTVIKAIHDFMEEQNYMYVLPSTINKITSKLTLQTNEQFVIDLIQERFKKPQELVLSHQLLINGVNLPKIYSFEHIPNNQNQVQTLIHVESTSIDFTSTFTFIEQLLRRILVDLKDKIRIIDYQNSISNIEKNWINNFTKISSHDISMEFFDDWQKEATDVYKAPFFVFCISPKFFDQIDPNQKGDHYLNFESYLPNLKKPVIRGGMREYRFDNMMSQMKRLSINRYDYSNYLLYIADNSLQSSSGFTINVGNLVEAVIINIIN